MSGTICWHPETSGESCGSQSKYLPRYCRELHEAITVIIACLFSASRRMADGLMATSGSGEVLIGCPLVGVDNWIGARMGHDQRLKRGAIRVFAQAQPDLPTSASHDPHNRGTIRGQRPVTTRLVRSPARWVAGVGMLAPFFAGVLV